MCNTLCIHITCRYMYKCTQHMHTHSSQGRGLLSRCVSVGTRYWWQMVRMQRRDPVRVCGVEIPSSLAWRPSIKSGTWEGMSIHIHSNTHTMYIRNLYCITHMYTWLQVPVHWGQIPWAWPYYWAPHMLHLSCEPDSLPAPQAGMLPETTDSCLIPSCTVPAQDNKHTHTPSSNRGIPVAQVI